MTREMYSNIREEDFKEVKVTIAKDIIFTNGEKIKAVIFDFGGTLGYAHKNLRLLLNKNHSLNLNPRIYNLTFSDVFHTKIHKDLSLAYKEFARLLKQENNAKFLHDLKDYLENQEKNFLLFPGSKPTLKILKKHKYKIGLLSNFGQRGKILLVYHEIMKYFDVVCFSAFHKKRKPDLDFFKMILRKLRVKPSQALMVGDNYEKDYIPAMKLGMHALLIERKGKRYKSSIRTIRNLRQVITYIKRVNVLL